MSKKNSIEIKQPWEISVNDLFQRAEYIIPIYQRNFTWGETEISQLLEDINDAKGTYYIGSLIVDSF